MEEIESLIGEAVRVELTTDKPTPAPALVPAAPMVRANAQSAPVVPPLTAGIPPRRAAIKDKDSDANSPEAAILAAAAASGAEVGRIDSVKGEASPYKRVKAKPERRSGGMRQYVGMAVAGTLLLAAGFGLYWVLGMGRGTDADAPVLTADATPVKEVPPPAPASTATQQGAVVFNELDGGNATVPTDEQLVSRDDSAATSVADVARTVGEGGDAASESELRQPQGSHRDGAPGWHHRFGRRSRCRERRTAGGPAECAGPAGCRRRSRPNCWLRSRATRALPMQQPQRPVSRCRLSIRRRWPLWRRARGQRSIPRSWRRSRWRARPTGQRSLVGPNSTVASAQPVDLGASRPAPAPWLPLRRRPAAVARMCELSSQPSQADAESALRSTQNRLANILGGRSLAVRQVDLGAKGTWYRVVLPVPTFQDATDTCAGLKSNGIDCVPIGG